MNIDIEYLRKDLKDYYGTAMFNASPLAIMDLSKVEKAGEQELIRMAQAVGLNLNRYQR